VTNPGSGYLSAPTITVNYPDGTKESISSRATLFTQDVALTYSPKGIMEEFETMYGRMNAVMSSELPSSNWVNQTSVMWSSVDSPTEVINTNSANALTNIGTSPIETLPDGTQIWRYTHNGVDTHFLHFHMFNVQVIARYGWDGVVQPLAAYDLGWRDTVQFDPLTILYVAIKPVVPVLPWAIPNSIRPLSPSEPLHAVGMMMATSDPTNNPVTQTNELVNFGWEYMIHCHLLGHEENDMMRPMVAGVVINAPLNVTTAVTTRTSGGTRGRPVVTTKAVTVSFVDNSINETGFLIQRRELGAATWTDVRTVNRGNPSWNTATQTVTDPGASIGGTPITWTDNNVTTGKTYEYRVRSVDTVGTPNLGAFPSEAVQSDPSNSAYAQL